jgi:hypothetical protein
MSTPYSAAGSMLGTSKLVARIVPGSNYTTKYLFLNKNPDQFDKRCAACRVRARRCGINCF